MIIWEDGTVQVWQIILLIVLLVAAGVLAALYFFGRRLEKKQAEQQEQIDAAKQQVSILVIDKKRLPLKSSGLPQMIIDNTPWYLRRGKVPVVKGKYGPRVMTFIADEAIFDQIPVKKEVKATISGIYITAVKGLHGQTQVQQQKKGFFARLTSKAAEKRNELNAQNVKKK